MILRLDLGLEALWWSMIESPPLVRGRSAGKLILPSLIASTFASNFPALLVGLLLVDIGHTFGYPVGITAQIRTLAMSLGTIFALFMGVLSVRFNHKSLLLTGLLLKSISALGCGFAPIFAIMLVSYSMQGIGAAMTSPMSYALVGEHFPREKRGGAIGWIVAAGALAYVIGPPVIDVISGFGGWRLAYLGFILPVILLSLLMAFKGLPSTRRSSQSAVSVTDYLAGFKGVLSNKSANACLVGSALSGAAWMAILIYAPSFLRQRFLMPTGLVSIVVVVAALCYTCGSFASGRFAKRLGRKSLTVLAALGASIFAILYTNLPDQWLSVGVMFLGCLFAGMRLSASTDLTLEQVPAFRGTMMSINHATVALADALGSGIGGLALLQLGYGAMAISLGAMGIAAAIVFHLLAIDPTKTKMQTHS